MFVVLLYMYEDLQKCYRCVSCRNAQAPAENVAGKPRDEILEFIVDNFYLGNSKI